MPRRSSVISGSSISLKRSIIVRGAFAFRTAPSQQFQAGPREPQADQLFRHFLRPSGRSAFACAATRNSGWRRCAARLDQRPHVHRKKNVRAACGCWLPSTSASVIRNDFSVARVWRRLRARRRGDTPMAEDRRVFFVVEHFDKLGLFDVQNLPREQDRTGFGVATAVEPASGRISSTRNSSLDSGRGVRPSPAAGQPDEVRAPLRRTISRGSCGPPRDLGGRRRLLATRLAIAGCSSKYFVSES